jgi:ribonucleoside-diphosphate reductase alpha chain
MRISRRFTSAGRDPFEHVPFERRASRIINPDGSVVFEASDLEMPAGFSQVATDIMAQKYFRKAGVPSETVRVAEDGVPEWLQRSVPAPGTTMRGEQDSREAFHRLAGTWAYWGQKYGYFDSDDDAHAFYDELAYMMATQRAAPNSPQWFNTGLHWAYGIEGPAQGHSYVDPDSGELTRSTSAYARPQPHACFIQSVQDDLVNEGGIMDLWTREARIFKYGSGTGSNFSAIRGESESLSGGGKSSGLMSFLKIGDRAAGAIKSGGTTRRAAKMVIVNADHPDVEDFIDWKVNEEQKVAAMVAGSRLIRRHLTHVLEASAEGIDPRENRALRKAVNRARRDGVPEAFIQRVLQLVAQGEQEIDFREFDTDWQGEAYVTVAGQNSNNSVRVTADFLRAVDEDRDWELTRRTDGALHKTVRARDLWDRIGRAAWQSADPGLQYDTTINEWHTTPAGGRINGSNPCSEYMFLDDTACNLASINLLAFTDLETGEFDIEGYQHAIRLWTIVLEISVLMAQYPSERIAQLSHEYRTLGLGYANLGALLMLEGIPYDSPEALAWTGALTAILTGASYATSAEMAGELGTFPRYAENREQMLRVIRNHRRAAHDAPAERYEDLTVLPRGIDGAVCPPELLRAARAAWDEALGLGEQHGFRNAQTTLIAPTGTIGLLMDCDTTGVEPDFALVKFKKLAGGGYFRIINESVPTALKRLGYSRSQIDEIIAYAVGTQHLEGAPIVNRVSLAERGFTQPVLDNLDAALRTAFHIRFVFNRHQLGDDFCHNVLGFTDEQLNSPSFDMLSALGFSSAQIEAANDHILGRMTTEGAPHLREEHYAVFDCANKCGKYGTRYIEPLAHVRTMAAAQPFISGAISKTINMPEHATVEDVKEVYAEAARSMVKALALYRDGSKLSQPLASSAFEEFDAYDEEEDEEAAVQEHPAVIAAQRMLDGLRRGQREALPARRSGYSQKAKVGGHTIYIHTGEFEGEPGAKSRLGEVFIDTAKDGAAFRSLMNCFAIAVSMGLQYGVPLEKFVDTFVFTKFEPNGLVTGHDRIQFSSSIIDYIFRELAVTYLGRDELAHLGPVDLTTDPTADDDVPVDVGARVEPAAPVNGASSNGASSTSKAPAAVTGRLTAGITASSVVELSSAGVRERQTVSLQQARESGFEGDPCPECGQLMMVRNGTCLKCMACGTTTGCS